MAQNSPGMPITYFSGTQVTIEIEDQKGVPVE
jgi:hypothetical protein